MSQSESTSTSLNQYGEFLDGLADAIADAKSVQKEFGAFTTHESDRLLDDLIVEAKTIGDLLAANDLRPHIAGTL